ncbi:uncharacterized protein LOC119427373 [Nematolebias whitei]|uniref:uncharacterized protein LOC119427373 n=1 Tax=Nematolebias whitei TaxID=451745 RepID=UPI00189975A9|nr:uncharacterized protein LOC119427373 [Nematolebias whitei]
MMCKMDSSTDSDSEISPRWSDTSTLGCRSSATSHRTASSYKFAGRHASPSLLLDPYDGSSEDSDQSNAGASISSRQTRQQGKAGGCRLSGRRRRPVLPHALIPHALTLSKMMKTGKRDSLIDEHSAIRYDSDVQMGCGGDPELWDCDRDVSGNTVTHLQTTAMELQLNDSGFHMRSSTPKRQTSVGKGSVQMLNSCLERSSCNLRSPFKRKVELQEAEVDLGPRKRHYVENMEDEHERKD